MLRAQTAHPLDEVVHGDRVVVPAALLVHQRQISRRYRALYATRAVSGVVEDEAIVVLYLRGEILLRELEHFRRHRFVRDGNDLVKSLRAEIPGHLLHVHLWR